MSAPKQLAITFDDIEEEPKDYSELIKQIYKEEQEGKPNRFVKSQPQKQTGVNRVTIARRR